MSAAWAVLAADPSNVVEWLQDPAQRQGSGDIPGQLWITMFHARDVGQVVELL